ncbi:SH3 domain-containing protein [Candidatus Babeliales bacterium]|nr:SH3 domain-containing protein [Candidatus Babeliales bacterium]
MFLYTIIALATLCSTLIHTSSDPIIFRKAQQSFIEGHWQEALDLYSSLTHKDSVVWQNMGNSCFNLQQYPHALLYWKRSYKDAGFSIQRVKALLAAEHQVYKKLNLPDLPVWYDWLMILVTCIPIWLVYIIIMLCLLFLLKFMLHYWRWHELAASQRKKTVCIMMVLAIMGMIWYGHKWVFQHKAIVVKSDTFVYAGPEQTFHIVSKVGLGTVVRILEQTENMYKVTTDTTSGWLEHKNVQKI